MTLYEKSKGEVVLKIKLSSLKDMEIFKQKEFQNEIEAKLKDILELTFPDCNAVVLTKLADYTTPFTPCHVYRGKENVMELTSIEAIVLAVPRGKED